ncbi:BTAD domain-containing putative transcriptional regulator [Streptomyces sp. NPDC059909]|uniref:BTAD domain-containing putative transcriptional regulator n=1 Tax=Streptomyces sp. NPDC059909 TaxID=3346998 RepID=UPI00365E0D5B
MRYLILGVTEARDERGRTLPVGGPRLRALLAALAGRAGRAASVGELVEEVWGGEPPHDAPAALQALVGRLRRVLGKDAVESTPAGYRLAATPDDIDLYVFERLARTGTAQLDAGDPTAAAASLREALALWRGPAFADLPDGDLGVRPEAQRLAAVRQRIEADLRRGATDSLVPELEELISAHPYDETLRAQLIRALRAEGRHADALAAYEGVRRALAEGLGTDPGPELVALHQQMLQASAAPAPAPPTSPTPPAGPLLAAPEPEGNLRPRLTSFVGREREIHVIRTDLTRSRLVTLTGPGGAGKTRLAEEAAAGAAWLAELAPLDDPAAVPGAVLSALGLRETNLITREGQPLHDDPTTELVEHLANRRLLLVLDNCEHVIGAAAGLAEALLTHCPQLRILATSREPLGVPGESVRPVDSLPPEAALRLLADRGAAANPAFRVEDDPEAAAEICRRLDGLPLAIELAAARLRMLTPRQIADRLDDRFRLLTSGSRTVLPRQQTLRAVVDWSWDLLDDAERSVLRQVSVFAGGWDLAAAEAVTGTPDAPALLGALVDKSLVTAAPGVPDGAGEMRFRLLETIHEYATERAAETPQLRAAAERAHTAHFTAFVEQADPELRSARQLPWMRRMEADLDNIRAALHRTTVPEADRDGAGPDESYAIRLVLAMSWFWWLRNYRPEGLAWVNRTIALAPGPDGDDRSDPRHWPRMHVRMLQLFLDESRAKPAAFEEPETRSMALRLRDAFRGAGPEAARFPGLIWPFTSYFTDGPDAVRQYLDECVANCRAHGGEWETGVALIFRAHLAIDYPGGVVEIDGDLAELRELSRRVGDRWMRAEVASAVGEAGMVRGRYEEAHAAYTEALGLAREVGARAEAPFLIARLAELAYRRGDVEAAEKGLDEASEEAERSSVQDTRGFVLFMRAVIALERGEIVDARRFADTARTVSAFGSPPPHFDAALSGLDARIAVHEQTGGPLTGLRGLAAALRAAREARCTELVTAHLAENAASVLPMLGEDAFAVRVLAAAEAWRTHTPRSVPERRMTEAVENRARTSLGEQRFEAERSAGAALTLAQVIEALEAATLGAG